MVNSLISIHFYKTDKINGQENRAGKIINLFRVFDLNGTGTISAEDLKRVMTTMGEKLTSQEVFMTLIAIPTNIIFNFNNFSLQRLNKWSEMLVVVVQSITMNLSTK